MKKKLLIIVPIVLLLVLVGSFFVPAQEVGIEGIGKLSIESRIALAVQQGVMGTGEPVPQQIDEELVEQTWMRTKNSKVFHSYGVPNRDYHDIYLDAIQYEVGHNREIETLEGYETVYWTTWEDIDNTLEPAGELSPWDWKMVKADYNIYMLEDFTSGQILKFEKADPYGVILGDIAFQPMALQWTNDLDQIQEVSMPQIGTLSVVDNKIQWNDAYGSDIDFSWVCYSTRLVKLLTISSLADLPVPEEYILEENPVLELNLIFDPSADLDIYIDGVIWSPSKPTTDTFGIIEFKLDEETLWGFMPLTVWDSSENEVNVTQRVRRVGSNLYVSIRIPYNWMQGTSYPIYIDAVIDEWVETSSDDAHEVVSGGSMDLTDTIIDFGYYTGGPTHAGFRFTGIDTTDVENVDTAYLEFYPAQGDSGAVSYTWYGEDVASATTFTTTAYDISNRTRTTASVIENPPANWSSGTWVQTTDLSNILNEVFSRGDWVSGNDLAILNIYNSGSGERRPRSWDYNDHSKAPKLHFENPTEVTYYYDEGTIGPSPWTDYANAFDGNLATFAYTATDGNRLFGQATTCPGTDLGTITKVELRVYGYGDGNDRIDISFDSGVEYQLTMPSSEDWSTYADVTDDAIINGWTWAKVADLWTEMSKLLILEFDKVQSGGTMYAAKVEIRVTYWAPPVSDIDVGATPLDRPDFMDSGWTLIDKNNPANASGTLQNVKVYAATNITGLIVGTFYTTNGDTLKCRDSEAIGDVTAGSEQTFPDLSITVETGDYIGCYFTGGDMERDTSGFSGVWYVSGEYIDPNDETTYTLMAGDAISLYGYGDFADGADISNAPSSKAFGVVTTSTDYWSIGSAPTWPLDDSECYFTVTNNGDTASITIKATNFTGGVGWTLAGSPGENIVTMKAAPSGTDLAVNMTTLTTGEQSFIDGLAGSATKKWEIKIETPTSFTDGVLKESTITLTATLD